MVKICKCSVCHQNIKTHGKNSFQHCSIRQPITDDNWLNKPQNQPKADTDGNKEIIKESVEIPEKNNEVEAKQEELAEQTSPESSEIVKFNKEVQNAPSNSSQEAHTLEIEQEDEENPAESYNHQCGACGTYFNEFKEENGRSLCPHCSEDWTDYLYGQ